MNDEKKHELPDFKQLDDRHIAPPAKGPILAIRTNLDDDPPGEEEQLK